MDVFAERKETGRYWISEVYSANKAREAGLEPTTYGLEVRCSIQLSYSRVWRMIAVEKSF
jgi:hypothetical protein